MEKEKNGVFFLFLRFIPDKTAEVSLEERDQAPNTSEVSPFVAKRKFTYLDRFFFVLIV